MLLVFRVQNNIYCAKDSEVPNKYAGTDSFPFGTLDAARMQDCWFVLLTRSFTFSSAAYPGKAVPWPGARHTARSLGVRAPLPAWQGG